METSKVTNLLLNKSTARFIFCCSVLNLVA